MMTTVVLHTSANEKVPELDFVAQEDGSEFGVIRFPDHTGPVLILNGIDDLPTWLRAFAGRLTVFAELVEIRAMQAEVTP